jgi:hypothetical protein
LIELQAVWVGWIVWLEIWLLLNDKSRTNYSFFNELDTNGLDELETNGLDEFCWLKNESLRTNLSLFNEFNEWFGWLQNESLRTNLSFFIGLDE